MSNPVEHLSSEPGPSTNSEGQKSTFTMDGLIGIIQNVIVQQEQRRNFSPTRDEDLQEEFRAGLLKSGTQTKVGFLTPNLNAQESGPVVSSGKHIVTYAFIDRLEDMISIKDLDILRR